MAINVLVGQGFGEFTVFQVRLRRAIEYGSSLRNHLQTNPSAADVWYAYQGENPRYWGYVRVVGSTNGPTYVL